MPPKRTFDAARAAAAVVAAPMTAVNSHMKTVTQDVVYAMDWKILKKMITDKTVQGVKSRSWKLSSGT
ncbi:hypothetical protein Tco_0253669 [Tanacetum coccineum]